MTWEDQQNINNFSKFNMRKHELEALIAGTKVGGGGGACCQGRWRERGIGSRASPPFPLHFSHLIIHHLPPTTTYHLQQRPN